MDAYIQTEQYDYYTKSFNLTPAAFDFESYIAWYLDKYANVYLYGVGGGGGDGATAAVEDCKVGSESSSGSASVGGEDTEGGTKKD
jgi:hypothetical protein